MKIFSDTKPSADVEYLSSAVIRTALENKFKELFGRDPVAVDKEAPMKIEDARVPDLISESVDPNIAKLLKISAVESSKNASGKIPGINNATLLYVIREDSPAEIPLASVPEFKEMDQAASDATVQEVSELDEINVTDNVAYVAEDLSAIEIGVFVDNTLFAEEFQYRVKNAGGNQLSSEEKTALLDEFIEELPGGENLQEENLRNELLSIVGLTSEVTPTSREVPEDKKAPGPGAEAETPVEEPLEKVTMKLSEVVQSCVDDCGYTWAKICSAIEQMCEVNEDQMRIAQKIYLSLINGAKKYASIIAADYRPISAGSVVVSTIHSAKRIFTVENIFGDDEKSPDIVIKNCTTGEIEIANKENLLTF